MASFEVKKYFDVQNTLKIYLLIPYSVRIILMGKKLRSPISFFENFIVAIATTRSPYVVMVSDVQQDCFSMYNIKFFSFSRNIYMHGFGPPCSGNCIEQPVGI